MQGVAYWFDSQVSALDQSQVQSWPLFVSVSLQDSESGLQTSTTNQRSDLLHATSKKTVQILIERFKTQFNFQRSQDIVQKSVRDQQVEQYKQMTTIAEAKINVIDDILLQSHQQLE